MSFSLFGNRKKIGGVKNLEKIFSPEPTNFFLSNQEEKPGEKTASLHFYKNALSNVYNNPALAWQNKKKEARNNPPTTKPNTTNKHHNLAQKINPKSTEN